MGVYLSQGIKGGNTIMKTPQNTLIFVKSLFNNDCNMLEVTLEHNLSVQTLGGSTEYSSNVIQITFNDVNNSDCFDLLNLSLNDFLGGQSFKVIYGDGDTMLIFLT